MGFDDIAKNMAHRDSKRLSTRTLRAIFGICGGVSLLGFNLVVNLLSEANPSHGLYKVWGGLGAIGVLLIIISVVMFVKSKPDGDPS